MSTLAERLIALHRSLDAAGVPHAVGGAIALAYCTDEPRGTRDLDINVFVGIDEMDKLLNALPSEINVGPEDIDFLVRDGQVRLWWADMPVDFFLDVHEFHHEVAARVRTVPFEGTTIPVLDCVSLTVFKAMFDRSKDWADIEAMVESGTLDGEAALRWVDRLLGRDHPAAERLAALVT